jgi:hypothetical protein
LENEELTESWQDKIINYRQAEPSRRALSGAMELEFTCKFNRSFCPAMILSFAAAWIDHNREVPPGGLHAWEN